ncbi:hypothetical protein NST99_29915 [Paenibacillus sp. FSL L8-0470]|uniref:hypothetical protein n=1 Tax=unclassified Paenibacillus TaxID=185978 RepID=UPI0030F904DD
MSDYGEKEVQAMHKDIITVEGKLTPLSSKTHITYQFHLDYPLSSLEIDFRYAPKQFLDREASQPLILEAIEIYSDPAWVALHKKQWDNFYPLQNLLTLSLDSPLGFRGSAHRHAPEQKHMICPDGSKTSPGFISGDIPSGVWKITISVHCVVTPDCRYELFVRGTGR